MQMIRRGKSCFHILELVQAMHKKDRLEVKKEVFETNNSRSNNREYPPFSVSMCVYGGDNAEWFDVALGSVINQTVEPSEIVLVVDGSIPQAIQDVIHKYEKLLCGVLTFKVIFLDKNEGHGIARRASVSNCSNELIALMDADDICLPLRFEREINVIKSTNADVVGSDIAEFIGNESNILCHRCVPVSDKAIKAYMKKRCPFNQMTVLFKKTMYEKAGNYIDWYCNEDYYLWIRMALSGARFANTGDVLVHARVGDEMYQRRGGIKYFRSEKKLQQLMLDKRLISFPRYVINVTERVIVQVLMPNKMRSLIFQKFARRKL